jgi:hypothetical protein
MRQVAALALLLAVAGCGQAGSQQEAASDSSASSTEVAAAPPEVQARVAPPPPPASPQPSMASPSPGSASGGGGGPAPDTPPAGAPLLAYAYSYGVEAPTGRIVGLLQRHEQACQAAGPTVCQVIGASTQQQGEHQLTAQLRLRATPAYVQHFRGTIEGEVANARGEIVQRDVETEDLTRSIVDTEARLRATRLLQARLEQLIASRPGNLAQLLEIERELARVQAEIDAAESTLSVMRARVAMSLVTIDYASSGALVTDGTSRPLKDAVQAFASNVAAGLAGIIVALSFVLPWALVIGLAVWAFLALRRRFGTPTPKRRSPPPPEPVSPRPSDGSDRPGSS